MGDGPIETEILSQRAACCGWVVRKCRGVLLMWIIVGQGPIVLAVGVGGGCLDIFFSHLSLLFSFSLYLGDGPI